MPDEYSIHLNFLPVIGEVPAFRVYRKLRVDPTVPRSEGLDVQGYSLPRTTSNTDERGHYWVGFTQLAGYEEFRAEPEANNDLTRWAIFKALCEKARRQLSAGEMWIPERGFLTEIHFPMRSYSEGQEELVVQPYRLKAVQKRNHGELDLPIGNKFAPTQRVLAILHSPSSNTEARMCCALGLAKG